MLDGRCGPTVVIKISISGHLRSVEGARQKSEPATAKEKIALDLMRDESKSARAFVNQIAAPV